jgi:hypothetical protein
VASIYVTVGDKIPHLHSDPLTGRVEVFQLAVGEQIDRLDSDVLARECGKLDPQEEQAFADMGLSTDLTEWPAY